jgi:hypothetical protein
MPTSFSRSDVSAAVYDYAVALAAAGRLFTLEQLARHPELSWRRQSAKRASEFLSPYRDSFEVIPWLRGKPYLWRLTEQEKRKRGLKYRSVGPSQHTEHWLALGDLWAHLVMNGLRPSQWFTEGNDIGRFDVFAVIHDVPYLFEVQLSDLSKDDWNTKWYRRWEWLKQRKWTDKNWAERFTSTVPKVVLVTSSHMQNAIATLPKGALYAPRIDRVSGVIAGVTVPKVNRE